MNLPSQRLLDRISFEPTSGCWLWTGTIMNTGYGALTRRCAGSPGTHLAHRLVYEELVGPIPDGMCLDHKCELKSCVNPDHLHVVSASENLRLWWARRDADHGGMCKKCGGPFTDFGRRVYGGRIKNVRICKPCDNALRRERARQKRVQLASPSQGAQPTGADL